jgi:hypothetical protein
VSRLFAGGDHHHCLWHGNGENLSWTVSNDSEKHATWGKGNTNRVRFQGAPSFDGLVFLNLSDIC